MPIFFSRNFTNFEENLLSFEKYLLIFEINLPEYELTYQNLVTELFSSENKLYQILVRTLQFLDEHIPIFGKCLYSIWSKSICKISPKFGKF